MNDEGSYFVHYWNINYEKDLKSFSVHFIFSVVVILRWHDIICVITAVVWSNRIAYQETFPLVYLWTNTPTQFSTLLTHPLYQYGFPKDSTTFVYKFMCMVIIYIFSMESFHLSAIRVIKVYNVNLTPLIVIGVNSNEVKLVSVTD